MSTGCTPTPWTNRNGTIEGEDGGFHVADVGAYFAEHEQTQAANAAFIVRAVNSHEQLVAVLTTVLIEVADGPKPFSADSYLPGHIIEQIEAALAAASA